MAAELPLDLISVILQFLPVKILFRFRCVSKSFRSIIDSPDFIKSHVAKTSDNRIHRKIIIQNRGAFPIRTHVLHIDDPFLRGRPRSSELDKPYGTRYALNFFRFLAHCNGLVVLEGRSYKVDCLFLWNPSIRKFTELPLLHNKEVSCLQGKDVCFGYDSSIDDYKFMFIKQRGKDHDDNRSYEIWILGLKSGNWRRIELHRDFYIDNFRNCFVDGAFYFLRGADGVVLAFDLAKETFSKISLPDLRQTQHDHFSNLHVLEGCLCVSFYYRAGQPFELYARKKNHVGEFSWTKLFSITCQSAIDAYILRCCEILGFSKRGDKMYMLHRECEAYSYDFKEKNVERISAADKHDQNVFFYIESLVWMK